MGYAPAARADGADLDAIISRLRRDGVAVLLAGISLLRTSASLWRGIRGGVRSVAERHDVPLYPFFLDGVAGDPQLNQSDGIHPRPKAS